MAPVESARRVLSVVLVLSLVCVATAFAQGKPPDLSGIWQRTGGGAGLIADEPPMTAWGREKYAAAKPIHGPRTVSPKESNAAELRCLPMGIPGMYFRPRTFEIVQLPTRALMLFEVDHMWREIHLDGRQFPDVPLHSWMGYSIGRYEGDALVIGRVTSAAGKKTRSDGSIGSAIRSATN